MEIVLKTERKNVYNICIFGQTMWQRVKGKTKGKIKMKRTTNIQDGLQL